MTDAELQTTAAQIEAVVFDVDGVLTDGRIIYNDAGQEFKHFHVQDGASIKLLAQHGIAIAFITGRSSDIVARRAGELGIERLVQGAADKCAALDQLTADGFPARNVCAIGDDIQDLPLFDHAAVALAATVPNAHPAVLAKAQFVTRREGGSGVAVELAELLLRARGAWDFA